MSTPDDYGGNLMAFWAANARHEPKYTRPEEVEALRQIADAVDTLKRLGWRDAVYCPKDGSTFLVVEAGCTTVFPCRYRGEWPKGSWWVQHAGDEWPSRPILFRPMRKARSDEEPQP